METSSTYELGSVIVKMTTAINQGAADTFEIEKMNRWLTVLMSADTIKEQQNLETAINRLLDLSIQCANRHPYDFSYLSGKAGIAYHLVKNFERTGETSFWKRQKN